MASSEADVNRQHDDSHVTAQQWKWTVLAGMASYLDAGSIVALAAGLALWQQYLGMSSTTVGTARGSGSERLRGGDRSPDRGASRRPVRPQAHLPVRPARLRLGHPADRLLGQPTDAPYRNLHSGRRGRRRRADLTRADRGVLAKQGPRQAHGSQPGGLESGPDSRTMCLRSRSRRTACSVTG